MPKSAQRLDEAARLRRRAEACRRKSPAILALPRTEADTQRLLHELEVHQIELEMQNAELQRARVEMETALVRYTELYDFAPVGYFSVDQQGVIQEVNLTGAAMLGVARSGILERRLQSFVAPSSRPVVDTFLATVFAQSGKQSCEALLKTTTGADFWADLQAASAAWPQGEKRWCRLTISDIAALKQAEEAQRRVELLAVANREANREIARRRAVEASLKQSEQRQRELLAESQELQAQLRHLTHQILLTQEEERKTISRQLHDEIAQILTGIKVQLTLLSQVAAINPRVLRRRIDKTRRLVGQSIGVVHRFARDLRPALLDDLGLIPALRSFIRDLAGQKRLRIRLTAPAGVEGLDNTRRTALYRVAQEALTNVARHARARQATVRILKTRNAVRLEVHDNGKSFPTERLLSARHGGRLGLLGMRERVEMVGGRFAIASTPGEGTTITAEIPLNSPLSRSISPFPPPPTRAVAMT